jgi:hypothetical protein
MNKIEITLFLSLLTAPLLASAEVTQPSQSSSVSHRIKNVARVVEGVGLGLAGYIATELPVILIHEYGHYLGNSLTGGKGGRVRLQCNIFDHPLGVLMPFFGLWDNAEEYGHELASGVAGPLAGLSANYGIMVAANVYYASRNGALKNESLRMGLTSPVSTFKNISKSVEKLIVQPSKCKAPSRSETFMATFNTLRATRMFGEFLYGLTPISIENGDGHKLWQELGLKKDMSVEPTTGLCLALAPAMMAVVHGAIKGLYLRIKGEEKVETINSAAQLSV